MRFAILLPIALALAGCFHLSGRVEIGIERLQELSKTTVETHDVPARDRIELKYGFSAGNLEIRATRKRACEDREVRVYGEKAVELRELPWQHWIVFASGAGLAGTAYFLLDVGQQGVSDGDPFDRVDQENAHDLGVVFAIAGAVLVTSEVVDWILAMDSEVPLPDFVEVLPRNERFCSDVPASDTPLVVGSGKGVTVRVQTDSSGTAQVDLESAELKDLPYAEPFLKISCDQCSAVDVFLPSAVSAARVLSRGRLEEMDEWLRRHPTDAERPSIEQARIGVLRAGMEKSIGEAESALPAKDFVAFERAVDEGHRWLAANGETADADRRLRVRLDGVAKRGVALLCDEANSLRGSKEFDKALEVIGHCVDMEGYAPECVAVQKAIEDKKENERLKEERRLQAWGKNHRGRAEDSARSAVAERLKSPASAKWLKSDVIVYDKNSYIVHVVVDSMNSFGVYLRGSYCVAIVLDMDRSKMYFIHTSNGIAECSYLPTDDEILSVKRANAFDW